MIDEKDSRTFTDARSIAMGVEATKGLVKVLGKIGIEVSSKSARIMFGAFALYLDIHC
ncbi:hypothetical protein QDY65_05530 [Pyrococcus kukulkanii]|uniref:hypothetical protein n=1 Tax=Pyrococcus kukulkanii TaxID=1609559 RepID=UPI003567E1D4